MGTPRCSNCGSELLAEARFCRQCGVLVPGISSSELPTAVFEEKLEPHTTQRLDPRPTSPEGKRFDAPGESIGSANPRRRYINTPILAAVIIVVIAIISSVAYVKMRGHNVTTDSAALVYPGSKTIVDVTSNEDRSLHLQSDDAFDKVVAWYDANLKPTKTMRLTSTSVVLKNQRTTTTIASEAGKTNILIKQRLTPQ